MNQVLKTVEATISAVTSWTVEKLPDAPDPSARAYSGECDDWRILAVDYAVGDKRGQDGTATNTRTFLIVHLTRELAKKAVETAKAKLT